MYQTFDSPTRPEDGPPRLAALRAEMEREGVDAFLVPRADIHQGEYVADADARLQWLTGFTGSAGFACILRDRAGIFVDGRYRVQVRQQVADAFTPVHWPETTLADWLTKNAPGARVAYDPWLHTVAEIDKLAGKANLVPTENLIDRIWSDRPPAPQGRAVPQPIALTGQSSGDKRREIAALLKDGGQKAAILTLPDSISWLLNIRGTDIPRNPVVQALAIIYDDARVTLAIDPHKTDALGPDPAIDQVAPDAFGDTLRSLEGPVRLETSSAPVAVKHILENAGIEIAYAPDPCALPKACKTPEELEGHRAAQTRDAIAMIEFLAWLDAEAPGNLTEIAVVKQLEAFRRQTNALKDISFETISGSGPNGAIVHYRVTTDTDRPLADGELLLVDSGGQYVDGTTDITRTIAIGTPGAEEREMYTRVLSGMIAISMLHFPKGVAGAHLDTVARMPLWEVGRDFDHGTGHGVGSYLSVHEGPQRLARSGTVPLEPGMILSNEPGYYREGAFGIRLENLIAVRPARELAGADPREMLSFETLTWVPFDRSLIDVSLLSPAQRAWLNDYHAQVAERVDGHLSPGAASWLALAVKPV
ncbi:MAG: aminopeptidase P family protein [Shimia sp.]